MVASSLIMISFGPRLCPHEKPNQRMDTSFGSGTVAEYSPDTRHDAQLI